MKYLFILSIFISVACLQKNNPKKQETTIMKSEMIVKEYPFQLGDSIVTVLLIGKETDKKIIYFNLHENETTSIKAGNEIVNTYGGMFYRIKAVGNRLITFSKNKQTYQFDPNRIFTKTGIKKTLEKYSKYTADSKEIVERFSKQLIDSFFTTKTMVVALHNNSKSAYSILHYKKGQEYEKDADSLHISARWDESDFFYVTNLRFFQILKNKDFNVVLQNDKTVEDDGSLSVFCGMKNIPYINVEAGNNHLKEQIEMIREILSIE